MRLQGRKPTRSAKADEVNDLKRNGKSVQAIATELGISVGSVHRLLKPAA